MRCAHAYEGELNAYLLYLKDLEYNWSAPTDHF